ncbi:MAG TPA: serine/threonine protein kinase [Thermoleophilia bacterium]|nr:serine/threonine protein kinase [Thermoleophilia bacterium]
MPNYAIYGLSLRSDTPIPTLPVAVESSAEVDVDVRFASAAEHAQRERGAREWYAGAVGGGGPGLLIRRVESTGDLLISYPDGMGFRLDPSGNSIVVACPDELTLGDAAVYLLGPVLGIVLRLRGAVCLHGSVVALDNEAVGFVGPEGAGKSSTAAALAREGHRVLSDDLLVVHRREGRFDAEPGYPLLRLWPASVGALYGSPQAMPQTVAGWDKRHVDLNAGGCFADECLPLAAIHVFGERRVGLTTAMIEPLSQRQALLELIGNIFAGRLPGASARRSEFEFLSSLTETVPVRRLVLGSDWEAVGGLARQLRDDLEELAH